MCHVQLPRPATQHNKHRPNDDAWAPPVPNINKSQRTPTPGVSAAHTCRSESKTHWLDDLAAINRDKLIFGSIYRRAVSRRHTKTHL